MSALAAASDTLRTQLKACPDTGGHLLVFDGDLTISTLNQSEAAVAKLSPEIHKSVCLKLEHVDRMDTAGAWLIYKTMRDLRFSGVRISYSGATDHQEVLIEQALINDAPCDIAPPERNSLLAQVEDVGEATVEIATSFGSLLSFLGVVLLRTGQGILNPSRLRWTSLVHHMEIVGLRAMPIIGLICFLIGIVMVQQGASQLRQFGAEIFVVNLIGLTGLRELGVLLTAIMVAGRSGSAFTAQIGSMKLNEEIDAMRTIGLDPIEALVVPRFLALVVTLPLLTFFADLMVLFGGMILAWTSLSITPSVFITQLQVAVFDTDFYIGIIKAPVFALVISVSGCLNGLAVGGNAASVGNRTTRAVVESIFLVIVLDAFFAVFFTAIGW